MKKTAKKLLSVFLTALLVLTAFAPASAASSEWGNMRGSIPVVHVFGDGAALYSKDGEKLLEYRDLLKDINSDDDGDMTEEEKAAAEARKKEILRSVANVVLPFLIQGLGSGDYTAYYESLEKEIGDLFRELLLDKDGNVPNGSGISKAAKDQMESKLAMGPMSSYGLHDYVWNYDWRLDPLESAELLHTYVERVKAATGSDEVILAGRCLGASVVTAYVSKYGMDSIHAVGLDGGVVNGSEVLSETISGKFKLDGNALGRFLVDCDALGMFSVNELITEIIDMLSKAGVFMGISNFTKETIYYQVVKGVTSALALSTFFTFPAYWAAVKSEDYEEAKSYVFGEEGSEKRKEYAGLIAKLDNYDKNVRQRIPQIMDEINNNGNLAIIAKYGVQIVPVIESRNAVADQFASVTCASYGATTSSIYGTLSDDYIARRVEEGNGKYISPDKQIDASTCQFPEQTWFVKGAKHSQWTAYENEILASVLFADRQLTVDDSRLSQFVVFDVKTSQAFEMTEENCNTYYWEANQKADEPESDAARLFFFVISFLKVAMRIISMLLKKAPAV